MAKHDDSLFLLEVLIDKIVFVKSPCFSDKDFRTCVNIEAPAVEPLEICDDDPGVCIAKSGGPFVKTFNSGKSCLFSLKEHDISTAMSKFPIKISIYKSLPCGCLPTKIIMGEATIDMTKEFVQARKKFLEDPSTVSYQALKDSFRITGPDGGENGEILMFLRISCFGKLIITRFQGVGGPPTLGAGGGSTIVDRSCNPRRDFQSANDPCACGTGRGAGAGTSAPKGPPCMGSGAGGGVGPCPLARDPYNSMPCEDPDDPCYCYGPRPDGKPPMMCRNTDQYCLHLPKGALPRLPFYQELNEEQKRNIKESSSKLKNIYYGYKQKKMPLCIKDSQANVIVKEILHILLVNLKLPTKSHKCDSIISYITSISSISTQRSKRRSVSFSDSVNYIARPRSSYSSLRSEDSTRTSVFSNKETTVYMTLFDDFCLNRTSGTQATASINKCLQVARDCKEPLCLNSTLVTNTLHPSTKMTIQNQRTVKGVLRHSDVYFFGKKKNQSPSGSPNSKNKKSNNITAAIVKSEQGKSSGSAGVQAQSQSSSTCAQTNKSRGSSAGTCTGKAVSINECYKEACPAVLGTTKGDMTATVSHIRIGPSQTCPVHGRDPCQGPKCVLASAAEEQQAPVKVSTVTNPRRGVFELVIRRMTGAPLAKNELMLEWTPPQSRPPSCNTPCAIPCSHPTCRPSKCRMIVCRPTSCKPKCCRRACKKPCGPPVCRPLPCKKSCKVSCKKPCRSCNPCSSPCKPCPPLPRCRPCPPVPRCKPCPPPRGKPCPRTPCRPCPPSPCKPCPPPPCRPCPPAPRCAAPCIPLSCCNSTCGSCCVSSPCLRPCPVGRRKPRRARSHPRMKPHKKYFSPCYNRANTCPVVRCRSTVPCFACCAIPPPVSCPRKSCSVFPFKPLCSKSNCSSCCD